MCDLDTNFVQDLKAFNIISITKTINNSTGIFASRTLVETTFFDSAQQIHIY